MNEEQSDCKIDIEPIKKSKCVQLFCGNELSYFSCVFLGGLLPGLIWFCACILISGLSWGLVDGTTGLIVGIVFLCMAFIGAYLFIHCSICYSHYYPSDHVGSLGCCPWFFN